MPSTTNPTCPLCGLRFENKPLLDLHIREDHRPPDPPGAPRPALAQRRTPGWRHLHPVSIITAPEFHAPG